MINPSNKETMGLRARKQRRQRAAIIENAIALFRQSSIGCVPVRSIAARCEISEATFFNYFPSKDAVLAEWAEAVVDDCFETVAASPTDRALRRQVRDAVRDLASRVEDDAELMRAAWSRVRAAGPPIGGRDRARKRGRAPGPAGCGARALIERARERGEVRGDVEPEELAELLLAGLHGALGRWLADPERSASTSLEACLVRATDVLLDGFRKRNQRVRATATPIASAQS
jgi:AcrR family transcriptional regulator